MSKKKIQQAAKFYQERRREIKETAKRIRAELQQDRQGQKAQPAQSA